MKNKTQIHPYGMKWFRHDNDLRKEPEFQAVMEHYGPLQGYGLAMLIWEVVSQYGDKNFRLPLAGKFGLDFWKRELGIGINGGSKDKSSAAAPKVEPPLTYPTLKHTDSLKGIAWMHLQNAASSGVIDQDALNSSPAVVYVPALHEHLDEYRARLKKSERGKRKKNGTARDRT